MLFGRRKPGYTTTVDGAADPEQVVLDLQKAEMAAKKKPKAEVFSIDAASETARRLKETGSTFDGSAAKAGEDVMAVVERETSELAAKQQAAEAAPEAAEAPAVPETDAADAKPELLDFLAAAPDAENDPYADQPTKTAPELPELTPAQQLAGFIRSRSAAALVTAHAQLASEVENADELLAQMPQDPQCEDIVSRTGAKDTYYYSSANMSDNYAMIAQLIEDRDLCVMFAEMVRFNARIYPSATPLRYFQRSPYGLAPDEIEQTWKTMQGRPEFADIEELTNNQNERFLFSTQYLTRRYAKAISDVDEFCD
jgi:chemotaxis protein histidine kinase CheA